MMDRSPLDNACQFVVLINPLRIQKRDKKCGNERKSLPVHLGGLFSHVLVIDVRGVGAEYLRQ
jgi:hypothetical protein